MNRLRTWYSFVCTTLGIAALCLSLPSAASAQGIVIEPPDPDPGPFCLIRATTTLEFPAIIALQGPMLDSVNWTRSGNTFDVTVKLRPEHRYGTMSGESCMYDDGLFTAFSRSINVSSVTPEMFFRDSPTTTHALVTVIDPTYPTRYSFNIKYQENVGAFSLNFNPMRKKKICVDLPTANGATAGVGFVRNCSM